MRKYRILVALLFALLCTGCEQTRHPATAGAPREVAVELWHVQQTTVAEHIESVATLAARESVALSLQVSGKVSALHFEDGDTVAAGQMLLELDATEAAARVAEVEAALAQARLELQRLSRLGADISTRAAIDIARASVAAEEARLAQARAILEEHRLRAPFAGVLGFREVSVGALITPGTEVTQLDAIDRLKLDFTVPEVHLSRLRVGDSVEGHSPAWPDQVFVGSVRSIGSRVDPVTRAVTVRATLDNASGELRPGMLLTVNLLAGEQTALVVPEQALLQRGGSSFVYSVDDAGRALSVPVRIERRVEGGVLIEGELVPGTPVVLRGHLNLRDGTPVRAVAPGSQLAEGPAA